MPSYTLHAYIERNISQLCATECRAPYLSRRAIYFAAAPFGNWYTSTVMNTTHVSVRIVNSFVFKFIPRTVMIFPPKW